MGGVLAFSLDAITSMVPVNGSSLIWASGAWLQFDNGFVTVHDDGNSFVSQPSGVT